MSASAEDMLVMTKRRACSAVESPRAAAISRNARFVIGMGLVETKRASSVCSAVRLESVAAPSALTSLYSAAYFALARSSGPFVRNCDVLFSVNGRTFETHAKGSLPKAGNSAATCRRPSLR